jgi:signal transduction histidine kinase
VRIHPYRAGSELTVGIVVSFLNISELKNVEDALAQVETRYRHLFQSEMFGIALGNLHSKTIIDANDAYLRILDIDRSKLPIQQQLVYPESELPELERSLRELEINGSNKPSPIMLKKANGKLVPVIVGQTLISDIEGTYIAFIIATNTLNDQAGLKLQERAHELESVRNNLHQFAYIASHQLEEPLKSVQRFTKQLSTSENNKLELESAEDLNQIEQGLTKLSHVTEDLLLYSRSHNHAEPMTSVDTHKLVDEAIAKLSSVIDMSDTKVSYDDLPVVNAEKSQLKQVFVALIDNAVRYKSDRTPEVEIKAQKLEDAYCFSITDNGRGIKESDQERVFKMFQQDGKSNRGLGLAISKKIIERHNGRIWIETNDDDGTIVNFTLPARNS